MSKEDIIYRKVLKDVLKLCLDDTKLSPEDLKVETLVEKAMAKVGKLKWVGDQNKEFDFEDGTDAKTSSVAESVSITYKGSITGTCTKQGALRCVVTNEFSPNEIDYFYIPHEKVKDLQHANGTKSKKAISYTYNIKKDKYSKIDQFRVKSFKEVSTRND